jgi:hypothetical protein
MTRVGIITAEPAVADQWSAVGSDGVCSKCRIWSLKNPISTKVQLTLQIFLAMHWPLRTLRKTLKFRVFCVFRGGNDHLVEWKQHSSNMLQEDICDSG